MALNFKSLHINFSRFIDSLIVLIMIHEEICTYEVAKLAKEKGFNDKCYHYYQKGELQTDKCFNRYNKGVDSICSAPTQSLLQRWLREEKGIIIEMKYSDSTESWRPFWSWIIYNNLGITLEIGDNFATYEQTLEDALKYALDNLV